MTCFAQERFSRVVPWCRGAVVPCRRVAENGHQKVVIASDADVSSMKESLRCILTAAGGAHVQNLRAGLGYRAAPAQTWNRP